jgi:hypothetical protein
MNDEVRASFVYDENSMRKPARLFVDRYYPMARYYLILGVLFLVLAPVAYLLFHSRHWLWWAAPAYFGAIFLFVRLRMPARTLANVKKSKSYGELVHFVFTPTEIHSEAVGAEGRISYAHYRAIHILPDGLMLLLGSPLFQWVPRSAFASESDFERVSEWLKARPVHEPSSSSTGEASEDDAAPGISASFAFTLPLVRQAILTHLRKQMGIGIPLLRGTAILLTAISLASSQRVPWTSQGMVTLLVVCLAMAFFAEILVGISLLINRKSPLLGTTQNFRFSPEGFSVSAVGGAGKIGYEKVLETLVTRKMILIYVQPNLYHLVPRSAFASDEDYRQVAATLAARTKNTSRR